MTPEKYNEIVKSIATNARKDILHKLFIELPDTDNEEENNKLGTRRWILYGRVMNLLFSQFYFPAIIETDRIIEEKINGL